MAGVANMPVVFPLEVVVSFFHDPYTLIEGAGTVQEYLLSRMPSSLGNSVSVGIGIP